MSTYSPGEKDAQIAMMDLLRRAEAMAPKAGLVSFEWRVKTVTGLDTRSGWDAKERHSGYTQP